MAKIKVTGYSKNRTREVSVDGINIPDVISVAHEVVAGNLDRVVITICADSYEAQLQGGEADEVQEAK